MRSVPIASLAFPMPAHAFIPSLMLVPMLAVPFTLYAWVPWPQPSPLCLITVLYPLPFSLHVLLILGLPYHTIYCTCLLLLVTFYFATRDIPSFFFGHSYTSLLWITLFRITLFYITTYYCTHGSFYFMDSYCIIYCSKHTVLPYLPCTWFLVPSLYLPPPPPCCLPWTITHDILPAVDDYLALNLAFPPHPGTPYLPACLPSLVCVPACCRCL